MIEHVVVVHTDGTLRFLYNERLMSLQSLGTFHITRASFVEPDDTGRWTADMSPVAPGVVLGPFERRSEALAAEVKWLEERL